MFDDEDAAVKHYQSSKENDSSTLGVIFASGSNLTTYTIRYPPSADIPTYQISTKIGGFLYNINGCSDIRLSITHSLLMEEGGVGVVPDNSMPVHVLPVRSYVPYRMLYCQCCMF